MWLIVTLKVQDGKQAEFEGVMAGLAPQVLSKEPGALVYQLTKKQGGDGTEYVMVERYKDQAALAAHGQTDYFRAASPKMGACLAGAPTMLMLDEVGG